MTWRPDEAVDRAVRNSLLGLRLIGPTGSTVSKVELGRDSRGTAAVTRLEAVLPQDLQRLWALDPCERSSSS